MTTVTAAIFQKPLLWRLKGLGGEEENSSLSTGRSLIKKAYELPPALQEKEDKLDSLLFVLKSNQVFGRKSSNACFFLSVENSFLAAVLSCLFCAFQSCSSFFLYAKQSKLCSNDSFNRQTKSDLEKPFCSVVTYFMLQKHALKNSVKRLIWAVWSWLNDSFFHVFCILKDVHLFTFILCQRPTRAAFKIITLFAEVRFWGLAPYSYTKKSIWRRGGWAYVYGTILNMHID